MLRCTAYSKAAYNHMNQGADPSVAQALVSHYLVKQKFTKKEASLLRFYIKIFAEQLPKILQMDGNQ